jgi:hypothetical protein
MSGADRRAQRAVRAILELVEAVALLEPHPEVRLEGRLDPRPLLGGLFLRQLCSLERRVRPSPIGEIISESKHFGGLAQPSIAPWKTLKFRFTGASGRRSFRRNLMNREAHHESRTVQMA